MPTQFIAEESGTSVRYDIYENKGVAQSFIPTEAALGNELYSISVELDAAFGTPVMELRVGLSGDLSASYESVEVVDPSAGWVEFVFAEGERFTLEDTTYYFIWGNVVGLSQYSNRVSLLYKDGGNAYANGVGGFDPVWDHSGWHSGDNDQNFRVSYEETGGTPRVLAGTIAAITTVVGLNPTRARDFTASFAALSTLAGAPPRRVRPTVGSLAATSTVGSSLIRSRLLAGSFAAVSSLTGRFSRLKLVTGGLAAVSTVVGAITRGRGLGGSLAGVSTLVVSPFIRARNFVGSLGATSSVTAGAFKRARKLIGAFPGVSTFTGTLVPKVIAGFSGVIAAVSTFAGAMTRARSMGGSLAGTTTFSGVVWRARILQGALAAVSTVVGALSLVGEAAEKALAGVVGAVSSLKAGLTVLPTWTRGAFQGITAAGDFIFGKIKFRKEK